MHGNQSFYETENLDRLQRSRFAHEWSSSEISVGINSSDGHTHPSPLLSLFPARSPAVNKRRLHTQGVFESCTGILSSPTIHGKKKMHLAWTTVSQRPAFVSPMPFLCKASIAPLPMNACSTRPLIARGRRPRARILKMTTDLPHVSAKTLFTDDISLAESLFAKCVFSLPTGAAALASSRNVEMPLMSRAYGHVLASTIRDTIPAKLNAKRLAEACFSAAEGRAEPLPLPPVVFEQWLASVKNSTTPTKTDEDQLALLSQMYGIMLGRTVRLTAFELDSSLLAKSLEEALEDPGTPFPMPEAEYNNMFADLEDSAATILGTSNLDVADRFFEFLREEPDTSDLQGDGYILSVNGSYKHKPGRTAVANLTNTVRFAWRVRLLDGRALFVPNFSDGEDSDPDYYETPMDSVTPALGCVLCGMKPHETRTAFYHPYAAREVLEMLLPADQFPAQAGLVVDVYLKEIL